MALCGLLAASKLVVAAGVENFLLQEEILYHGGEVRSQARNSINSQEI
jgi:hypothetical protein